MWLKLRVFSPALILMLAGAGGAGGAIAAWPGPIPFPWRLSAAVGLAYVGAVYAFGSNALVLRLSQRSSRQHDLRTWRHVGTAGLVVGALLATHAPLHRFASYT